MFNICCCVKINSFLQLFKDFLEQELQNYEGKVADGEIVEAPEKVTQEMVKPDVVKIGDRYYFISGPDQVFMMLTEDDAHGSDFARKLDKDEISNLPVDLVYLAKPEVFSDDVMQAFKWLDTILYNMNEMQDKKVMPRIK